MIALTEQQIRDAKNNELDAVTAVVKATEERVIILSRHYARTGGTLNHHLAEDLAQTGRIAVWEALKRFRGTGVGTFITYLDRSLKGALSDARKRETRTGVSRSAAANFEFALRQAGGDPYEAEKIATDPDVMSSRRMSPEMAQAAREAWRGTVPIAVRVPSAELTPEQAIDPRDVPDARSREIRDRVHATLAQLGPQQRAVLKGTYGIAPVPYYGTQNDTFMAADLGIPRYRIPVIRTKGKARFRELWLKGANEWPA